MAAVASRPPSPTATNRSFPLSLPCARTSSTPSPRGKQDCTPESDTLHFASRNAMYHFLLSVDSPGANRHSEESSSNGDSSLVKAPISAQERAVAAAAARRG